MDNSRDRLALGVLIAALGAMYLLCQNGRWLPGGSDDAFYVDAARSIASGNGFSANGIPVVLVPPAWPLVLAGGMKISYSFAVLNLIPLTLLLATSAVWYRILRRFASRWTSFWVMLGVGIMFQWQRLGFHLYCDVLFMLALALAVLLGLQMNEGRRAWWRMAAIAALCCVMVSVKWSGVAAWFPLAGALAMRARRPALDKLWVTAALAALVMAATFVCLRVWIMSGIEKRMGQGASVAELSQAQDALQQDSKRMRTVLKVEDAFSELALTTTGNWMTRMLWPPTEAGATGRGLTWATAAVGWVLLLAVMTRVWAGARKLEWMWVGVAIFYLALSFGWRASSPRHVMPVLPMLILAFWQGCMMIRDWFARAGMRRLVLAGTLIVIISAAACNAAICATNVWVVHSSSFAKRWQAGEYEQLLGLATRVWEDDKSGEYLALNENYSNVDRTFWHSYAVRMTVLTTGLKTRVTPLDVCAGEPNDALAKWCRTQGIKYYVYKPAVNPWRMWHFRIGWLQKMVTGRDPGPENPYYALYRLKGDGFERVPLPEVEDGLRNVPATRTAF